MKRRAAIFTAAVLAASCAACKTESGDAGGRPGKVADQRLATYSPIRRLTYRDVCGSEGPLTLCVDRVILSDNATLVEARVTNVSSQPYVSGNVEEATVLLANDTGMALVSNKGESMEFQGMQERAVRFKMEGPFGGEPATFIVNNIRRKSQQRTDPGFSVTVRLGQ